MLRRAGLLTLAALVAVSLSLVAGFAAAGGGPSPGAVTGWEGVLAQEGSLRYVALATARTTVVAAVQTRGGWVERFASIPGSFGIPLVAYDGSAGGLSHDGRTLVLTSFAGAPTPGTVTRFAILGTKRLERERVLALPGSWSYDALSPDGRLLYAVEYLAAGGHRVRAIDVAGGRVLPGSLADSKEARGKMSGSPMTRATGPDGVWAYTLYAKPGGTAFVHALDTRHRKAVCVDLPWRAADRAISEVRIAVRGGSLVLTRRGRRLAAIDTRAFTVRSFSKP
jgi:hypothetical protein